MTTETSRTPARAPLRGVQDASGAPSPRMTEKQLQAAVEQCARLFGWLVSHPRYSIASAPGFPDIIACRASRLLAIELKSATGKLSEAQERWLGALGGVPCCEVLIWRPDNWLNGDVERTLR